MKLKKKSKKYRNLQFLNNVIIFKTKVLFSQPYATSADFGYPVYGRSLACSQRLSNYLTYSLGLIVLNEGYYLKRVVRTKFDIYMFITNTQCFI